MGGAPRVAITGLGVVTPLGHDLPTLVEGLREGRSGVRRQPSWDGIGQLDARVAGEVVDLPKGKHDRKKVRTMGRVARLALAATEAALADAGLDGVADPRVGLAYGSTHGSSSAYVDFARPLLANDSFEGLSTTSYLKFMSNTCTTNLAQYYGVRGPVLSTCAACVSGSQAVGAGVEAIRAGRVDVMICGGAEELHWTHAGVFDAMMAASTRVDGTPRPFDAGRDGLVIGEGAGTVVLERWEHAVARGARIRAEVEGYGTNCDGTHVTQPSAEGMAGAMRLALQDAGAEAADVDYVCAHATATEVGDLAEAEATHAVFGDATPVSSLKGYMGHTLGACGAIEVAACVAMMEAGFVAATKHLERVDPRAAPLDHLLDAAHREQRLERVISNNFAFGGINTSLIFRLT
jgi:3-oxoacyl-[acyl-carrier-protein] synthase II